MVSVMVYVKCRYDAGDGVCDDWCDSVCRGEGSSKVKDRHW